jgi:enterochelin esterase-like enzyme
MMRIHLPLLALALLLAACSTAQPTPTPPPPPALPTAVALSPTAASPSPPPSPTPAACLSVAGTFESFEIDDGSLSRPYLGSIYLPPCYDADRLRPYPVLFLFHGLASNEQQWPGLGIGPAADRLILSRARLPFLIVFPAERKGIDLAESFASVLLPYVQDRYNASPARAQRAVGGLSRGAGWALRIGLTHPGLVSRIGLHSPAVLPPDMLMLPTWLDGLSPERIPALWIDVGDRDPLLPDAIQLETALRDLGLEVSLRRNPGYHEATYWSSHLAEYLEWYTADWAELR